jgi:hypothetical protein
MEGRSRSNEGTCTAVLLVGLSDEEKEPQPETRSPARKTGWCFVETKEAGRLCLMCEASA